VCRTDNIILQYLDEKNFRRVKKIYYHMADEIGQRMGWKLKKIERTNTQTRLILDQKNNSPIQLYD